MSLIHDSLRKLELETQEKKEVKEDKVNYSPEFFESPKKPTFNKLWMLLIIVVGLILVVYAYLMLDDYKKQNESLIKNIQNLQIKSIDRTSKLLPAKIEPDVEDKVIIETPIITNITETSSKKERTLVGLQSQNTKKQNNQKLRTMAKSTNKEDSIIVQAEPKKIGRKISRTRSEVSKINTNKNNSKLTVKQTRQLINQLQIQIEDGNSTKVKELLLQLEKLSGPNSLVYLRMNAYWLAKTGNPIQAMTAYKKIIFYKPNDIQAGTNLALLEANNNQLAKAIKRLNSLKKKHPSNKTIAKYLSKIESLDAR